MLTYVITGDTYSSKIGLENENADLHDIDLDPMNVSPESSSVVCFTFVNMKQRDFVSAHNLNRKKYSMHQISYSLCII